MLRLEDALLVVSKRRLLVLLVAAELEQARAVAGRLLSAAAADGAPLSARLAVGPAAPADGADWKDLFERLEPWGAPSGAPPGGAGT